MNMFKKIVSLLLIALLVFSAAAVAEKMPTIVTIAEWLESKGEKNGLVIAQVQQIINPVLAVIADETGFVNLFGVIIDGEFTDFFAAGISAGDLILIWNPRCNLFEGTIEMADAVLLRHAALGSVQ